MKHLLDILLIPCLIGLGIYIIAYTIVFVKYGKEIKEETDRKMKKKHPNWPKRAKIRYSVFPLNQYNE